MFGWLNREAASTSRWNRAKSSRVAKLENCTATKPQANGDSTMNFEPSSNAPISAIDLGQFNSMCCFFDPGSQESRFQTVPTNRGYFRSFLSAQTVGLVVFEACGPSGWLHDLCRELGLATLVCSTNEEAWQWRNVKRKTDKDDALKLIPMANLKSLKPVHTPSPKRSGKPHWTTICRNWTSSASSWKRSRPS